MTRMMLSALLPLFQKHIETKNVMYDILCMIRTKHTNVINTSEDECDSAECLLEILCQLRTNLEFPRHLGILGIDNFLWHYLAEGISHEDGLTRKRANYLLKRAIDTPFEFNSEKNGPTSIVPFMGEDTFKDQRKIWDDFFMVVETLEEKQVHLVKQVFRKISVLLSKVPKTSEELSVHKSFNISWILVIFKLLFQHQNQAIVRWSVEKFLTTFSNEYISYLEFIRFVSSSMLRVINSSKLFLYKEDPTIKCEMEIGLSAFLSGFTIVKNMTNPNQYQNFWNSFLKAVFSISWGPIPLYHVTRAISNVIKSTEPNNQR